VGISDFQEIAGKLIKLLVPQSERLPQLVG
jgi:hypothetical protein